MTPRIAIYLTVAALTLFPWALKAQDVSVNGTLTVSGTTGVPGNIIASGTLDVWGNSLFLGTHTGTPNLSGLVMGYVDGSSSVISFSATPASNLWQWQENSTGTLALQMSLSGSNTLKLYDSSSCPKITLDPLGTSTFANSLRICGSDTTMPNQTLTGTSSVLTEALADILYISNAATSLTIGSGATASGSASIAMGDGTTASGNYSFASGEGSVASGDYSTAMGNSTANGSLSFATGDSIAYGMYSTAMGNNTYAYGPYSVTSGYNTSCGGYYTTAMGCETISSGVASVAMGCGTWSTAYYSTSMGFGTAAQSFASVVMGQYNVGGFGTDGDTTWIPTDPLLELGNGTDTLHPSDALVVYKSGDVTASGTMTATKFVTSGTLGAGDIPMFGY